MHNPERTGMVMGRKRWIFEETGEERVPEVPDVFPAGRFDYEFVLSVGGWPVYFSSGDKEYPTKIIKLSKVEDIPQEEEKVTKPAYPTMVHRRINEVSDRVQLIAERVSEMEARLQISPTPPAPEPLKPCPFCGGEAMFGGQQIDKDGVANSHGTYRVFCAVCSASDGNPYSYHNNKQLAINGWNRRTP